MKNKTRNVWATIGIFAVFAILLIGSATQKEAPKKTFNFDYAPPKTSELGSANFKIALIQPSYAKSFGAANNTELFKRFREAMGKDIEELLIAKGFTLMGPYESIDEMIFEDKKKTDISLFIEVAPTFTLNDGGWKTSVLKTGTYYTFKGTTSMSGKINLTGIEPLSNEKIWVKSVEIPTVENIQITTGTTGYSVGDFSNILKSSGVYNPIGDALMEVYGGVLGKVERYIEPSEFNTLRNQVKELKSKKGY